LKVKLLCAENRESKEPIEIDYTQLSTWMMCPMKYHLSFDLGLKKKTLDERDVDMEFGKCFHGGLEMFYRGRLGEVIGAFSGFQDLPPNYDESIKTKSNGENLLKSYVEYYALPDSKTETLEVEKLHKVNISDKIIWVAKLDRVFREYDNIYGQEHKTTNRLTSAYFGYYKLNMQITGQTFVIQHKYGQCSGVSLNVAEPAFLEKAQLYQVGDPETLKYSNVEVKYCKYYKSEMAYCSGFRAKFERDIINRTAEQIVDFKENVTKCVNRMVNDTDIRKNYTSCTQFKGCPYAEICQTSVGEELNEDTIDTLYDRVEDPFKYQEGDKE
jgi:hypothetical protein